VVVLLVGFATILYRTVGRSHHDRQMLTFSAGAIAPIALAGFLGGFPVPIVLGADVLAYMFLARMWIRCVASDSAGAIEASPVPPGALAGAG
jgi:hypothetical protein